MVPFTTLFSSLFKWQIAPHPTARTFVLCVLLCDPVPLLVVLDSHHHHQHPLPSHFTPEVLKTLEGQNGENKKKKSEDGKKL